MSAAIWQGYPDMSAHQSDDFAPEPNRYSLANEELGRNVKQARQKKYDPWVQVLGGLDAALTQLERLALDDSPVPAEAVGPIAVVALRANPMMSHAHLRRVRANGSPMEAQEVVYAALGPVLVHKTYKTAPEFVPELIEDASHEHPTLLDDAEIYENVVKLDGLNRIQIWSAQEIKKAEQTIRHETDLDSPAVRQARAVLIHLKCGSVDTQTLEKVLQVPDEPLLPWVPEERRSEAASIDPERANGFRGPRVRVPYIPTEQDVELATSILDQATTGQQVRKGLLQRAQVIIEFREDPYVSRAALATKLGIPVMTIHGYRQEFADRGGFKVVGSGPSPKLAKPPVIVEAKVVRIKVEEPKAKLVRMAPARVRVLRLPETKIVSTSDSNDGDTPTEEEVALAQSVLDGTYAGPSKPFSLYRQAKLILAFDEMNSSVRALAEKLSKKTGPSKDELA